MRKIVITLNKGGVGKTTTAVNLAHGLSLKGKKTLLIDTDDQGQCAYLLGAPQEEGLAEVLSEDNPITPQKGIKKVRENLWLLSGGPCLAMTKKMISRRDIRPEQTLSDSLSSIEDEFDYVILDTSPSLDSLSLNALFYANEIVTPISLESLSLNSLAEFKKRINTIKKYKPELQHRYLLPTFEDKRVKKSQEVLEILENHFSKILCNPIRYNVKLSESTGHQKTIFEFALGSNGMQDYETFVKKVIQDE